MAPNESATKLAMLLDMADPDRGRDLCFGTVDTWVAWTLSGGALHVTDATNAAVTGLLARDGSDWDDTMLDALRIPRGVLPTVVDSSGASGPARALQGAPVICGIAGDQQASLVGQGCTRPGLAKATFGTGGMLDLCVACAAPRLRPARGGAGTFPIVAWQRAGHKTWGVEAVMLSAGMCVEWLRDDLGIIDERGRVRAWPPRVMTPATSGSSRPCSAWGRRCGTSARRHLRGITAARAGPRWCGPCSRASPIAAPIFSRRPRPTPAMTIASLRIDGGMSANPTFVAALADAVGRPVEISPVTEATTLGAAYLAGIELGMWADEADVAAAWRPSATVEPRATENKRAALRSRWLAARDRSLATVPELSALGVLSWPGSRPSSAPSSPFSWAANVPITWT